MKVYIILVIPSIAYCILIRASDRTTKVLMSGRDLEFVLCSSEFCIVFLHNNLCLASILTILLNVE